MATAKEHYEQVLANVYSWMLGGFEAGISRNLKFFQKHYIAPIKSGVTVDLGAGCGFQSIPLAQLGFMVTAIDLNAELLDELQANTGKLTIKTIQDYLLNFEQYLDTKAELIICMTDTILHLESKDIVTFLFRKVFSSLENDGKFIITFRDLSSELSELEQFIPVKSDEQTIFTCFLEYEPNTVKVHDLVYQKDNNTWKLNKNFYRKLGLSQQWVNQQLVDIGFGNIESNLENGLITIVAIR